MARSSRTGRTAKAGPRRRASPVKGRNPTRVQKAKSSSRKDSQTKSSIADLKKQVERQALELEEARQQQAASSGVLQIISASAGAVKPVFEAIVKSAVEVCQARFGAVFTMEGDLLHLAADYNFGATLRRLVEAEYPVKPSRGRASGRAILTRSTVQIPDTDADKDYIGRNAKQSGFRSLLAAPLLKGEQAIGSIVIYKAEPGTFPPRQMALLQNFATQAVIAISNVELFQQVQARTRELSEALTHQTGSAKVLSVIASSPTDVEPVLQSIVESACELCNASDAIVYMKDGDDLKLEAHRGIIPIPEESMRLPISRKWATGRAVSDGVSVHVGDLHSPEGDTFPDARRHSRLMGHRTVLAVPLLREGEAIGAIVLRRTEVHPFNEKQIALLKTFADQAVIAIENTRLFNETQEALERQTATAEILKVIASSPSDVQPVFEVIVGSAKRILGGFSAAVVRVIDGIAHLEAITPTNPAADAITRNSFPRPVVDFPSFAMAQAGRIVQISDTEALSDDIRNIARARGYRSVLLTPMKAASGVIGMINVTRKEPGTFSPEHVELIKTFADQAVIAIENTRLFNETKEALERQTATADVLKIISRSSVDLEVVLNTLVETVARLCRADHATAYRLWDHKYQLIAACGLSEEEKEFLRTHPLALDRSTVSGRVAMQRRAVHIRDVLQDPEYHFEGQQVSGYRTMLGIPLLRGDELIGIFVINRTRVEPYTVKEIELATTFADQAVIAIENARLFDELRERQAELRVTFDNMGDGVAMFDAAARLVAWNRNFQEMLDLPESLLIDRPSFADLFGYMAARSEFDSADLEAELRLSIEDTSREMRYERTRPDGRIVEVRRNPIPDGGFVLIYADITERKRAEKAIRVAKDAAEKAFRDLQTAQDRLIQTEKLASLGQLTAGIAHEIKNPLNFVNNFSALSSELTDELDVTLKAASLTDKVRDEVGELTKLLKDNLDKIVQHGKRADSIVKNMLLHSREGSGEHRATDINALVDESLNLAYHGARAEKSGFNITLQRDFDASAGSAELFPQEITRALLNLISNGFYAANKRSNDGEAGFDPTLLATTKSLGNSVEIRIRDNGAGIPSEIKEKIFNPFFTTKPAGEGTGLGLSMTHDIIVKQHGGTIKVNTQLGEYTEFILTLPRAIIVQGPQRSTN